MKKINRLTYFMLGLFLITLTTLFYSCKKNSTPKPYGYFRIDLPNHSYSVLDTTAFAYRFDKAALSFVCYQQAPKPDEQWFDIVYPKLRAVIHCTYLPIKNNLNELTEDSRNMVYKHTVKADAIEAQRYENRDKKVYGILYTLAGNVASPVQFSVTDSIQHFLRGVLYFENVPNSDSIAPVASYIHQDIIQLMESIEWKKQ